MTCETDCRWARELARQPEWLWCDDPAASNRLNRRGRDCPRFIPAGNPGAADETDRSHPAATPPSTVAAAR